ncbi:MAG: hypothetical protein AAGD04_12030 [Pseudomonadota bacterium]
MSISECVDRAAEQLSQTARMADVPEPIVEAARDVHEEVLALTKSASAKMEESLSAVAAPIEKALDAEITPTSKTPPQVSEKPAQAASLEELAPVTPVRTTKIYKPKGSPKAASVTLPEMPDHPVQTSVQTTAQPPVQAEPDAMEGRPKVLKKPRADKADDLKLIKGVGPKLAKWLNTMGVFHFDQVAGWTAKEVAWMDENLEGVKGRVSRDDWVAQARALATLEKDAQAG